MAEYEKKVRKKLSEHGCTFRRRGKGDHDIWFSPLTKQTFPVDSTIKSRHLATQLCDRPVLSITFEKGDRHIFHAKKSPLALHDRPLCYTHPHRRKFNPDLDQNDLL